MHYWRKDYFDLLQEVAVEAGENPRWKDYAHYCRDSERGLRRSAFTYLDRFIHDTESEPFPERRSFVSWLLSKTYNRRGQELLVPHPLKLRIVEPTLLEWTIEEPECSEPHRWLGGVEHLQTALALDSEDQIARRKLILTTLSWVSFATHELPSGYLGSPPEDLLALAEAEALVSNSPNKEDRELFAKEIADQKALIESYLRKK